MRLSAKVVRLPWFSTFEEQKIKIRKVEFEGNRKVRDGKLRRVVDTKKWTLILVQTLENSERRPWISIGFVTTRNEAISM